MKNGFQVFCVCAFALATLLGCGTKASDSTQAEARPDLFLFAVDNDTDADSLVTAVHQLVLKEQPDYLFLQFQAIGALLCNQFVQGSDYVQQPGFLFLQSSVFYSDKYYDDKEGASYRYCYALDSLFCLLRDYNQTAGHKVVVRGFDYLSDIETNIGMGFVQDVPLYSNLDFLDTIFYHQWEDQDYSAAVQAFYRNEAQWRAQLGEDECQIFRHYVDRTSLPLSFIEEQGDYVDENGEERLDAMFLRNERYDNLHDSATYADFCLLDSLYSGKKIVIGSNRIIGRIKADAAESR